MSYLGKIEEEFKMESSEDPAFTVPVYQITFAPEASFERAYDIERDSAARIENLLDEADAAVIGGPDGVVLIRTPYWRYFQQLAAMGAQANVTE